MANRSRKILAFSSPRSEIEQDPRQLRGSVLVVDSEKNRAGQIGKALSSEAPHVDVHLAHDLDEVIPLCGELNLDAAVFSLNWPESQSDGRPLRSLNAGLEALVALRLLNFSSEIIVFDERASRLTIEEYCRPFALGASQFLDSTTSDFVEQLTRKVYDSLSRARSREESERVESEIPARFFHAHGIVGESPAMKTVFTQAQKAARLEGVTVLITGESGTGKQMMAEALHRLDERRRSGPFVTVNCTAIASELAESELFGHKKGAFTGALADRAGYFRMAQGGTILLDEIGDLPLGLQPKLLRVLQEKKIAPVGEDREVTLDVRVIAATNRNLKPLVKEGRFRLDLYERLRTFCIEMPPLRERKEDLLPLMNYFLAKYRSSCSLAIEGVDPRVIEILATLDFPGNVREFENFVLRILSDKESGEHIEPRDLPASLLKNVAVSLPSRNEAEIASFLTEKVLSEGMPLTQVLDYCEKMVLTQVLQRTEGNRAEAARLLKTTVRTVFNKIHRYRLS